MDILIFYSKPNAGTVEPDKRDVYFCAGVLFRLFIRKAKLMKFFHCAILALVLSAVSSAAFGDGISITVVPSLAPNVFGSPSWSPYVSNALTALQNGSPAIGDRTTDPTAYQATYSVTPQELIVSSFHSWEGQVNPAAPFNNELGTRLHFGLVAKGDGNTKFTLDDLKFNMSSNDPSDSMAFSGNFVGADYSSTRFGVNFGADHALGGGDDTIYTSGNGTTPVDMIVYVGVGNSLEPTGVGSNQQQLDNTAAYIRDNITSVQTTYTIDVNGVTYSGTGAADVAAPLPSTALMGLGLFACIGGVLFMRRKARATQEAVAA